MSRAIHYFDMAMEVTLCISMLVACATAANDIGVSDAMAARVDAQAWRADSLTEQFQAISDRADAVRAAVKAAGNTARYLRKIGDDPDQHCRPNTRRCGKSAQCVSVMAFCDGVNDCKNHYDEDSHRCFMPLPVNTTFQCHRVYDHCWAGPIITGVFHSIVSHPPGNVYKVEQKLKVQITLHTVVHGVQQTTAHLTDGVYCKGTQRMILQPFSYQNIWVIGEWDGVDYDRYVVRLYRQISGEECAMYQGRKV